MTENATETEAPANEETEAQVETSTENETVENGESKPKRRTLTDQERVAKLEAELAAAREKANGRVAKQIQKAEERKAALVTKRDEINKIIAEVDAELESLRGSDEDEAPAEDENAA